MAFTYAWDTDFGNTPADSDSRKYGAQEIRKTKDALVERLQQDHEFGEELIGTGVDDQTDSGYHKRVTLLNTSGGPSEAATGYTEVKYDSDDSLIKYYPAGGAKQVLVEETSVETIEAKTVPNAVLDTPLINSTFASAETCTISVANPGVVTKATHGLSGGEAIKLSTTGALPTPLVAGKIYFVLYIDANTFNLAATRGGSGIETTVAGSGTHSYETATAITSTSEELNALDGITSTVTELNELTGVTQLLETLAKILFSAYRTAASQQTITGTGSETVIVFNAEHFDVGGSYNTSNGRWTPGVTGYFQINAVVSLERGTDPGAAFVAYIAIRVNGTKVRAAYYGIPNIAEFALVISTIVELTSTTDYIDIIVVQDSGVDFYTSNNLLSLDTNVSGCLLRPA